MQEQTLSLCIIAKNEENDLPRCLDSVKDLVNEIVLVDTGSTDHTIAVARRYGAHIYKEKWQNDFSKARNACLEKATGNWILLLDADEALDANDKEKLKNWISTTTLDGAHFTIRNYLGGAAADDFTVHNGFRLLRNTGEYHFVGEIHEQIARKDGKPIENCFSIEPIHIDHYGYLEEEIRKKNKRKRNIPLLEKQLQRDPENAFALFNMGNEYLALGDHEKTLFYYQKAYAHMNPRQAYAPHLFFRMANCLQNADRMEEADRYLQKALSIYPNGTDFLFLQALGQHKRGQYTAAVRNYEACLKLGEPPSTLQFVEGCGTYRAAYQLAELHFELEDYAAALVYYNQTLAYNPRLTSILYRIGAALRKLYHADDMHEKLYAYFADPEYLPNKIVAIDILLNEHCLEAAQADLSNWEPTGDFERERLYLTARAAFLDHRYEEASERFGRILSRPNSQKPLLAGMEKESACYLYALIQLMERAEHNEQLLWIQRNAGDLFYRVCLQMDAVARQAPDACLHDGDNGDAVAADCMLIFDKLLAAGAYDLFEKLLPVLNYANTPKVLLYLAGLYQKRGFPSMAVKNVLRSVKETDTLDAFGASILFHSIHE